MSEEWNEGNSLCPGIGVFNVLFVKLTIPYKFL